MDRAESVLAVLEKLQADSPAGYAIALHVSFTTPRYLFQTYPKEWMEEYSRRGFVIHDPTVRWGLENDGSALWSDLSSADTVGVLEAAEEYGLKYGVTVATSSGESKSVGSFARSDREFTTEEREVLAQGLDEVHEITAGIGPDEKELEAKLKKLSVQATHG